MVTVSTEDLLHPEILSRETLVTILSQRQIKLDHSQRLNKEVLVEIFHRTVTPLAQREPRGNRRGKATAKKIKRLYGKKTFKLDDNKGEADGKSLNRSQDTQSQQGGLLISANIPSSKARLKPPPVVKNRGIIRLNSSSKPASSSSPLAKSTKTEDGGEKTNTLTPIKVIRLGESKSSLEGDVAKISLKSPAVISQSQKISLKRPSAELSGDTSSSEDSKPASTTSPTQSGEGSTSPKKKIKKITWP
ncbi:uncharacterized protein [Amphiura filiformis]|uniref:uncharacterized protein n=1 Tax=Amphiura filiformis TaxID=82378 RepID=UPI003B220C49